MTVNGFSGKNGLTLLSQFIGEITNRDNMMLNEETELDESGTSIKYTIIVANGTPEGRKEKWIIHE